MLKKKYRSPFSGVLFALIVFLSVTSAKAQSPTPSPNTSLWDHYSLFSIVRALAIEDKILWVGTSNGLLAYDLSTGKQQAYTTKQGLLSNIVHSIDIAPNGDKWVGTIGGGLSHLKNKSSEWINYTPYGTGTVVSYGSSWKNYPKGRGLGDLGVHGVHFDPTGTMWVATWKGVSVFDGKGFKTYTTDDGLIDKWVYTLTQDKKGAFWFGTEAGVTRFDGKIWLSWDSKDGLGTKIGMKQPEIAKGLASTPKHHEGNHNPLTYNPNYVVSSAVDSKDDLWFGTLGAGLSHFDGSTWISYSIENGLVGNMVHALKFDDQGILWIGTNKGVSRFDGKTFQNFTEKDGIASVFSIEIDHEGHKWFGTFGGVSQYRGH